MLDKNFYIFGKYFKWVFIEVWTRFINKAIYLQR
ncbi:hypothetical protein SAMN05216417_11545 [Nitrosospira multiformis]|uniref:Uncharacterized protein n=1 Tax=Nitrosospira multiformis TaxID=1231 RepID=A0A1I7I7B3_9PROT|nr:hypothetical protein SAMN05216417_11545 [Nitrosospira multiformis]